MGHPNFSLRDLPPIATNHALSAIRPTRSLSMSSASWYQKLEISENTSAPDPRPNCPSLPLHSTSDIPTSATNGTMQSDSPQKDPGILCDFNRRRTNSCPNRSSQERLFTISEEIPQFYEPQRPHGTWPANHLKHANSIDPKLCEHLEPEKSRTMTRRASEESYRGSGVIYIQPSAQLASMQAVGEHLIEEEEDIGTYDGWTRSRAFATQSQISIPIASYIPPGSPHTVFSDLRDVNEDIVFWSSRASKWVQSMRPNEHSRDWIQDYFARVAEAERLEEEARREQENGLIKYLRRMNSMGIIKCKRNGKKTTVIEPRREHPTRNLAPQLHKPSIARSDFLNFDPFPGPQRKPSASQNSQLLSSSSSLRQSHDQQSHSIIPPLPFQPTAAAAAAASSSTQPFSSSSPVPTTSTRRPSRSPEWTMKRAHTVSGASLTDFMARKNSIRFVGVPPPDQTLGLNRSFSAKLGRKASRGLKGITARFEKLSGGSGSEKNRNKDGKRTRKDSAN